jgi:thiazole synthase
VALAMLDRFETLMDIASPDAVLMAEAMRDATIAGRKAYLAGRMPKRLYAAASSPLSGVVR